MTTTRHEVRPVERTVSVGVPPARAFELFTDEIGSWWPLVSHGVYDDSTVSFVGRGVGAQLLERSGDGEEALWGTVTTWEPPTRIAFTWHPGRAAATAQEVEVSFTGTADGTEVHLVHTGWEQSAKGEEIRSSYDSDTGWTSVLERFTDATAGLSA